ncbi:MAG: L-threonylcarbamoyladenylate synthase, partial [Armatimonadota bacterium]
ANVSGRTAPTSAECAVRELGGAVSVVLDAGECSIGVPSTVVDLSVSPPRIIRQGTIGRDELEAATGLRLD